MNKKRNQVSPNLGLGAALGLVGLLATGCGCGGGMSGRYEANLGFTTTSLEFERSRVLFTHAGMTGEGTYSRSGDEVKVTANGQTMIFRLDNEVNLPGGLAGMTLVKVNK
jgi:hypothetical protein